MASISNIRSRSKDAQAAADYVGANPSSSEVKQLAVALSDIAKCVADLAKEVKEVTEELEAAKRKR